MWQAQPVSTTEDQPTSEEAERLRGELDAALERESGLRAALVEAHRQRLESEDRTADRLDAALVDAEQLRGQLAELAAAATQAEERALAERVRRERLERTPPLRLLKAVAELPPLRLLRGRRVRDYERELARARGDGG
jgi:hypothetical protein